MSARPPTLRTRWMRAIALSDLHPTQKLVAYTIGQRMNAEGRSWPSVPTIAKESGLALRTVKSRYKEIVKAGLLEVERGRGRGKSNNYQAVIPVHLLHLLEAETVQLTTTRGASHDRKGASGSPGSSSEVPIEDAPPLPVPGRSVNFMNGRRVDGHVDYIPEGWKSAAHA